MSTEIHDLTESITLSKMTMSDMTSYVAPLYVYLPWLDNIVDEGHRSHP